MTEAKNPAPAAPKTPPAPPAPRSYIVQSPINFKGQILPVGAKIREGDAPEATFESLKKRELIK